MSLYGSKSGWHGIGLTRRKGLQCICHAFVSYSRACEKGAKCVRSGCYMVLMDSVIFLGCVGMDWCKARAILGSQSYLSVCWRSVV